MPVLFAFFNSLDPAFIYRFAKDTPPLMFTFLKALMALPVATAAALTWGANFSSTTAQAALLAVVSGVLGPCVGDAAYVRSIQLLGGSLAVIIGFTYIFFAQAISALVLGEVVTPAAAVGAVVAFTGVAVSTLRRDKYSLSARGVSLALVAAICWSLAVVLVKAVQAHFGVAPLAVTRIASALLASLAASVVLRENRVLRKRYLVAALVSGTLVWGFGMLLYIQSVYLLGVSVTVVALALTPVLSQLTTRFFSGERAPARVAVGAVLVAVGIALQVL